MTIRLAAGLRAGLALAAGAALLAGCVQQQPQTVAKGPPSADYATVSNVLANPRGNCFSPAELEAVRGRMLQQELSVATLQCRIGSQPAFNAPYQAFLNKYNADLTKNRVALQTALQRRGINFDAFVTDLANKSGQRVQSVPDFCPRAQRALEWGLAPQNTTLAQVPPVHDFSTELGVRACPAPAVQQKR